MNSSQDHSRPADVDDLIQRYLDQTADADDVQRLSRLIESDENVAARYVALAHVHATLAADESLRSEGSPLVRAPANSPSIPASVLTTQAGTFGGLWRWGAAIAVCLLLVGAGVLWWNRPVPAFATVLSAEGVPEFADGSVLHGEWHELSGGTVELMTARQARVVIEAPAKFCFETEHRLRLSYGRLAADVPASAKGFTVLTPTGDAVDLGTKFGVDVPPDRAAEIHVFQGEVIAQNFSGDRQQNLTDGEALLLTNEQGNDRLLRSAAFIQPDEVASLHAALNAGRQKSSDSALAKLRRDAALIALLDFETDDVPEGTYRMVQGRWPGSRAPEFVNVGDHMKLDVGGERPWPELTLAAWVRLDQLGAPYQSLLHTDGWSDSQTGQVHWMVNRETTMRLALRGNSSYPDSHTPVLGKQGRWVHLATTYDAAEKTVRFYLNGEPDRKVRLEKAHPALLGPAQIGNWDNTDRKLSGRIDELILLARVMTDAEVLALFEAGNPYGDP